ncbi:hypothetical protein [Brucella sp. B13-0095]|uniref:hypothetical protein n=1 Tax=unclassified Brucella TaxID=2632610 RepID=UPI0009F65A02
MQVGSLRERFRCGLSIMIELQVFHFGTAILYSQAPSKFWGIEIYISKIAHINFIKFTFS